MIWDTESFFTQLLETFPTVKVSVDESGQAELANRAFAKAGFHMHAPTATWGIPEEQFIAQRLNGELNAEELSWYEDCAEAFAAFACFALGGLLGKYLSGQIDQTGFTLGDAHLVGFMHVNLEKVCDAYSGQ